MWRRLYWLLTVAAALFVRQTNLHMRVIRVGTVKCDEEIKEEDQVRIELATACSTN